MHRIDGPTASPTLPAAGPVDGTPGYFSGGNPQTATPATIVSEAWANDIQENLIRFLAAAGIAPQKGNFDQLATLFGLLLLKAGGAVSGNLSVAGMLSRAGFQVWDSGNDGAGSGLDADMLWGQAPGYYTDIVGRLGYTPVRQGTGYLQLGNLVAIGWDGSRLRAQVDTSDQGPIWTAASDGAGSGLDADMLWGQGPNYYTDIVGRLGFRPANRAGDTFDGEVSAQRFRARSSGDGQAVAIGDDAWIGDANIANGLVVRGQADPNAGYVAFGSTSPTLGCNAGDGTLRYGGSPVWHAGNDGSGSGLDADMLWGQGPGYYTNIVARLGYTPANKAGEAFTGDVSVGGQLSRSGFRVWDAGNDGSGSGLDADLLDGLDASQFSRALTNSVLASEGHRIHEDGFKECWGSVTVGAGFSVFVPLPVEHTDFVNVALGVGTKGTSGAQFNTGILNTPDLTGFTIQNWENVAISVDWNTRGK